MKGNFSIPDDVVALIKAIVNQDRRERHAAGFKYGTYKLTKRISEQLGVNYHTVRAIKERRRRKKARACRLMQAATDYSDEKLEKIRQRRIRSGEIGASWKGLLPTRVRGRWNYRKALFKASKPG